MLVKSQSAGVQPFGREHIRKEEFEAAAVVRDQIRELEQKQGG
jgi:protein-arginine kinase activator protein McsA